MSTRSSSATATGIAILLISVSAGIGFDGYALYLALMGVLAGVSVVAVGFRIADDLTAFVAITLPNICALAAFPRRNLAFAGLVTASSAITAAAGAASPALCFGLFALHVLGISLIIIGVRGEWMV